MLRSDYAPMEAQPVDSLPTGQAYLYEPKWDGFRCLAFKHDSRVELKSRNARPLDRYFPEVTAALNDLQADNFALDGELIIEHGEDLSFDDLLLRIHPAESRIRKLSAATPATYMLFDLLVDDGKDLTAEPLEQRRRHLEKFASSFLQNNARILLSPATKDYDVAQSWWNQVGNRLDGIIAKQLDIPYQSGNRRGMLKVKKIRTADCVIGGYRTASEGGGVGSLLLGLYDDRGLLNHVGYTSSFARSIRAPLLERLQPLVGAEGFTGAKPGGPSRFSKRESDEWVPLHPVLVVEVQYDHFTSRFRHGTTLLRFRPDKAPEQCTYDQIAR